MTTNREGLTWEEWKLRSHFVEEEGPTGEYNTYEAKRAWQRGEDPTEWLPHLPTHADSHRKDSE